MTSKLLQFGLVCLVLLLTQGCLPIEYGYSKSQSIVKYPSTIECPKYDLTYSVDYFVNRSDLTAQRPENKVVQVIGERLRKSGLFNRVNYVPLQDASPYHFHFKVMVCAPELDSQQLEILDAMVLFIFPMWENTAEDVTGVVMLKGKPIENFCASEEERTVVWLPFLPVGLIWNEWLYRRHLEDKCLNTVINNMTAFHTQNYVKSKE